MPSWLPRRKKVEGSNSTQPTDLRAAGSSAATPSSSNKIFPSGLKVLHETDSDIIDVVFVHGLTGHREKTWTADGATAPWPQTLLPLKLPQARILTFGYDSYVLDWRAMASNNRIGNHSKNLLAAVAAHRENDDTNHRSLIFVAHSLGGLVCEDALLASRNSADAHLQCILECTHSIIFLGTPHSGSGFARWAQLLAKSIGLIKETNPQILEVLRADSEILARIQSDFHAMIRARANNGHRPIAITCFYEELPLVGIGEVVPMHSAILPAYISIGIRSDHMGMTKFESDDDPGFISVTGELQRWVKEKKAMLGATTSKAKAHFLVPFDRDPQFVGREDTIAKIDHKLETRRRAALAGIGGVGKSQIAIEYCYRFKAKYPSCNVFWVHGDTATRFDQAYKYIARKLDLPRRDDPNVNVLQLVFEWLSDEDHGTWLMVLDNADDIETFFSTSPPVSFLGADQPPSLINHIPRSSKGSVIITTRDIRVGERLADRERPIIVSPLAIQEAENLLRSKLPEEHEQEVDTTELLETLGYLPLAITQAAAYISENSITLEEYIETLRASDLDLTNLLSEDLHDPRRDVAASSSIVRTWKLSFDQIRKQKPRAAQLLSLMAVLDRHGVPKSLLRKEKEQRTEFINALGMLQAFSLISAEKGGEVFVLHRLVQLSTQNWLLLENIKNTYQEDALEMLSKKFPIPAHENWKTCEVLLPHAQVVLEYCYTSQPSLLHRAALLHNMAVYELQQGRYDSAYRSSRKAYDDRRRLLDENNSKTLDSLALLALVLVKRGEYGEAEGMHQRVFELREKVLGKEHPDTLSSMNSLAIMLKSRGNYEQAEEMHRRELELCERVLGKEHPGTLSSMNNLALVLKSRGNYEQAEEMHRRELELCERVLGKEHPDTLVSMNNLGTVLLDQGKCEEAEGIYQRVSKLKEKVLGKEHPSTLISCYSLALLLHRQRRYDDASTFYQRACAGYEKVLGLGHPNTVSCSEHYSLMLEEMKAETDRSTRLDL